VNLLYRFERFNLQNTSRGGGAGHRGSAEHLIGLEEEGWGYGQAEGLSRLEVNHQLKSHRSLDRQVSWLGALQDFIDEDCGAPGHLGTVCPIAHQAAGLRKFPEVVNRWQVFHAHVVHNASAMEPEQRRRSVPPFHPRSYLSPSWGGRRGEGLVASAGCCPAGS
jgi:hypothetical protein